MTDPRDALLLAVAGNSAMTNPDAAAIEVMARGICSTYRTGQCVKDDVDAVECSPCTAENCMPTRHATAALTALRKAGWSVTAMPERRQDATANLSFEHVVKFGKL